MVGVCGKFELHEMQVEKVVVLISHHCNIGAFMFHKNSVHFLEGIGLFF